LTRFMFRKKLLELLSENPMTLPQIARAVGEPVGQVEKDLEHLLLSLKHTDQRPAVQPSICRKCGFEFSPEKLRKPSRCPSCHGNWLTDPSIGIYPK